MVFNEVQFALFVQIMIAVLVGLAIFTFLHFRLRRRARSLAEKASPAAQEISLREYLQQEKKYAQHEQKRINAGPSPLSRLLALRQAFLTVEISAVGLDHVDQIKFWPTYTKTAESQPLIMEVLHPNKVVAEPPPVIVEPIKEEDDQIPLLLERITNLEKFKTLFFEIKAQLDQANQLIDILNTEMQYYVTDQTKQDEYNALINKLRSDNAQLNQQVSLAEKEYEVLMNNYASKDVAARINSDLPIELISDLAEQSIMQLIEQSASMSTNMGSLRTSAEEQHHIIKELAKLQEALNLSAEHSKQLTRLVDSLSEQNQGMQNIIVTLEEENQFLQKQFNESRAKQKNAAVTDERVDKLVLQLKEKTAEYNALLNKHVAMEKEYLTNFDELNRLKESRPA